MDGLPDFLKLKVLEQLDEVSSVLTAPEDLLPPFDFSAPTTAGNAVVLHDKVLKELASEGYVVLDTFVPALDAAGVLHELRQLRERLMKPAGMKKAAEAERGTWVDKSVRGDLHTWLQEDDVDAAGQLSKVLHHLREMRNELEARYGVSFGAVQTQATCYPGGQHSHYTRHLDASRNCAASRLITCVWYANECQGGQLKIFCPSKTAQTVEPQFNRCVIFQSRLLEHAVLPCQSERFAISQWICDDDAKK